MLGCPEGKVNERKSANVKSASGALRIETRGDAAESALGTGDHFIGAETFEDFRKFVQVATDDDMRFFIAVASAFGDEESGFNVVGSDDEQLGAFDAGVREGAFLLGVVDDNGFTFTDKIVHGASIFIDQNVRLLGSAKMFDNAPTEVRVTDNDDVVLHFSSEHAASFLGIVALESLQQKYGDNDPEENALSPERIENPEGIGSRAKVDRV